jgi:FAD/FMN-containing dehydrogenase
LTGHYPNIKGNRMALHSEKRFFYRGTDEYEAARRATVWNSLLPDRFPDVIMQACETKDVVAALRFARAHGYHVGVRSGGHSWNASHCATVACCSMSAASITPASTQIG